MQTVTIVMQMSSDETLTTVVTALHAMPGVGLGAPGWTTYCQLVVTIDVVDPDTVDIVREIIWQYDPQATQVTLFLDQVS